MNDFHRHTLLYCKHWYRRTEDWVDDLKTLYSKIADIDKSYYTEQDVWETLVETFVKFDDSEFHVRDFLFRIFRPNGRLFSLTADFRDVITQLIGKISIIRVKNNPKFEPFGFTIGQPDPAYLPVVEIKK